MDSHLNFAAFFDDAVIGMAIVGLDGRFQAVNPALCHMFGYPEEELIGRSSAAITHPDDRAKCQTIVDRLGSGAVAAEQIHKRYVRSDGTVVEGVLTTTVLRDELGNPTALCSQVVDVTPLVEMQEVAARSEERFKALVAQASDLIMLLDRERRACYVSPGSQRVLGYNPEELEQSRVSELVHPADRARAVQNFDEHSSTAGPAEPVRYRVRHRDGTWRHVEVVATNLFDEPSVRALVLNIRDVTDQTEYQNQLEAGELRFRALVANSWDVISLHDRDGRYLFTSPAVTKLGYDPERLIGRDLFDLIHPEDRALARDAFVQAAGSEQSCVTAEYRFLHRDGSWRWLESIVERRIDDPSIAAVVVTTRDVTQIRRRARQQQAVAELGEDALRGGPVENLIDRIPPAVAEALGVPHCRLVRFESDGSQTTISSTERDGGHPLCSCTAGCPVCAEVFDRSRPTLWTRDTKGDALRLLPVGPGCAAAAVVPVVPAIGPAAALAVCTPNPDELGPSDVAFLETVASVLAAALSRREVEDQLRRQAVHDGLSDLPNRTLLVDRLETALARLPRFSGSVAVLFIDVDNFKLINDSLGHTAGDSVVLAVAQRLRRTVRSCDTVGRFGGDEFVVVSEDTDVDEVRRQADRIREAVSTPLTVAGRTVTVTVSIGCVTSKDPAASPDSLLADADMAMYEAKKAGKNSVAVFSPALRRRTTDHLEAVSGIRRGIDADEFRLHYQPIFDITTGRPASYEALLRWQHPTSGLVLPGHFMDYAETSDLIIPLGKWVLHSGCAQSAAWRREGRLAKVSLNVSGRQLTGVDIADEVSRALETSGADPADILLEVTESALIADLDRARVALDALHGLGVQLGLDDFGTGWSSLSQLARLPFDFVKIDRSFVRDLETDERTSALLESIVTLCCGLGLDVVVEGVETPEQLDYLKQIDVRLVQGFLLGRPVEPHAVACFEAAA